MRVAMTGATGMIGQALTRALLERGDEVAALSRDSGRAREVLGAGVEVHEWPDPEAAPPPGLAGADAVVNLLGEPLDQRWTPAAKAAIRDSRVLGTRSLVAGLHALPDGERPATLVSQSATGFYGPRGDEPLDEDAPPGSDFVAGVVTAWEREALAAGPAVRVVTTRTGVVLSPSGGALARMLPFFRLGVGGPVAGGRQYVPWVHLDDVVGAMLRCLDDAEISGPVNVTAPQTVTNADFSRALGRVLRRPAVLPVPAFGVRLIYGEMAQVVTTGQHVVPRRLERAGYAFRHPDVEEALRDVLVEGGGRSTADAH